MDSQNTGFALDASIDYSQERYSLKFSARRSITQSSSGRSLTRQYFRLNADYKLTELVKAVASAYYIDSEDTGEDQSLNDYDQTDVTTYSLAPGLRWQIAPNMSVEARYDFRYRDDNIDGNQDEIHKGYLQFNYKLPKIL